MTYAHYMPMPRERCREVWSLLFYPIVDESRKGGNNKKEGVMYQERMSIGGQEIRYKGKIALNGG
jgi:hypothetical protein